MTLYRAAGRLSATEVAGAPSGGVATGTKPAFDLDGANLFGFKRSSRTRNPKLEIIHTANTEIEI